MSRKLTAVILVAGMLFAAFDGGPAPQQWRDPVQTIVPDRPVGMPRCGAEDGGPILPCYRERHLDTNWNVFTK